VYSFEPNPAVAPILRYNTRDLSNVRVFDIGLSDLNSELTLYVSKSNLGSSSVSNSHIHEDVSFKITVARLDETSVPKHGISLVKIDVEGHEFEVLSGAVNLLRSSKPVVIFEQLATGNGVNDSRILDLLKTLGYNCFALVTEYPVYQGTYQTFLQLIRRCIILPLIGEKICIQIVDDVPPGHHSMIVALPDFKKSM
jgi:FkbM family methyltransferase